MSRGEQEAEGDSTYPSLVWTGKEYGLAWLDYRLGDSEIYFVRISADGEKLGDEKPVLDAAANPGTASLAFDGDRYGIAWDDFRLSTNTESYNAEIYFALLSSGGEKIGEELRVTTATDNSFNPAVTFAAGAFRLVWQDLRDGNFEIYSAGVSAKGVKTGEDLRVTDAPGYSSYPLVGWTGDQLVTIWEDGRDDPGRGIYSAALSCP